ncbi:MAG: YraN family protein [Patescibacteria group bacterium]
MSTGSWGEDSARKFLENKGFKPIEKNFKTPRWGEIDLVMRDGDTLVFVEVKTRGGGSAKLFGGPLGAINYFKLRTLKRAAQFYIREREIATERQRGQHVSSKNLHQEAARIDAVSVILLDSGEAEIEHFPNITEF